MQNGHKLTLEEIFRYFESVYFFTNGLPKKHRRYVNSFMSRVRYEGATLTINRLRDAFKHLNVEMLIVLTCRENGYELRENAIDSILNDAFRLRNISKKVAAKKMGYKECNYPGFLRKANTMSISIDEFNNFLDLVEMDVRIELSYCCKEQGFETVFSFKAS